jgi:hypothetical protein
MPPLDAVLPIRGTKLLIVASADGSTRRTVVVSKDPAVDTSPGAGADPIAHGAFLHLYNAAGGGDSACLALPAPSWTASGAAGAPALRYRDPSTANGPCRVARMADGKLFKVVCRASATAPIAYSLDEPAQTRVGALFTSGPVGWCAAFEPTAASDQDARGRRFKVTGGLAPASCPPPPVPCP